MVTEESHPYRVDDLHLQFSADDVEDEQRLEATFLDETHFEELHKSGGQDNHDESLSQIPEERDGGLSLPGAEFRVPYNIQKRPTSARMHNKARDVREQESEYVLLITCALTLHRLTL